MTNEFLWYTHAKRLEEKGIVELPGEKKNNPDVMFMAKTMKVWYPSDEIAWCGLFVGYCLKIAGVTDKQPDNILGAKNWKDYGTEVETSKVAEGDILVFWRGTPKGPHGHVGFYAGETSTAYKVLGGNQQNSVNYSWVSKQRLLTIRRPKGYKPKGGRQVINTKTITLSNDER